MAAPHTEHPRWLIGLSVMLATVMVILDITIVNVTLPHVMGSLGATSDQITWVLTAYIVSQAIFIPATGFLARLWGRKRLLLISIVGFVTASALCGQAHSLGELVLFRIVQGAMGAPVIPLSQAVMVDTFPGRERGKAMALWGVGVMLGPVLGPTLGGIITQHLDWRWVFYINVPVGALNVLLVARLMPASPGEAVKVDWWGALLMALGVGSLQTVLDRGNQENWFSSSLIITLTALSVVGLVGFIKRGWGRADSIVNLALLRDRNLATASLMMAAFGLGLFGTIALQPLLMENLLHYPAETTGLAMAPRGLASAASMFMVSRLINRYDARYLILAGLALAAAGTYAMSCYNLQISLPWAVIPGIIQGLGLGMIFVPLSTLAYETVSAQHTDEASGIFNLARTLGASLGISIVSTVLSRTTQTTWNHFGGFINPYNPALHAWLSARGVSLDDPISPHLLAAELGRQAGMIGFVDAFWFVSVSFLILAPLVFVLRPAHGPKDA